MHLHLTDHRSIYWLEERRDKLCVHFQVALCWLPSDGGEQRDQSGLAAPHPAGVSTGPSHRSIEDNKHPLPPGPQVGAQTEKHTYTLILSAVCHFESNLTVSQRQSDYYLFIIITQQLFHNLNENATN